jgi:hypothetical protein
MTNKMQRCIILFVIVNALNVSSGFSAHHQELKSVLAASGICQTCLLLPLAVTANEKVEHTVIKITVEHNLSFITPITGCRY